MSCPFGCHQNKSIRVPEVEGENDMTPVEFFSAIAQLSGVLFVVTSMLAMGLSLLAWGRLR